MFFSDLDWLTLKPILDQYGLPLALLLGGAYVAYKLVYKGGVWLGSTVLVPVTQRVIAFLDGLQTSIRSLESSLEKLADRADGWTCNFPVNGCANYNPTDQPQSPTPSRLHPRQGRDLPNGG